MSPSCKLQRKRLATRPDRLPAAASVSQGRACRGRQSGGGGAGLSCANCSALVAVLSRRRLGGAAGATAATWREGAPLAGGLGGPAGGDAGWPHRRGARGTALSSRHLAQFPLHTCEFQGGFAAANQDE